MPFTGLEGLATSFGSLKVLSLSRHRDLSGADQAASLELMVENLEKDVGKWHA